MAKIWTRIDIACDTDAADYLAVEFADAFGVSVEFTRDGIRFYLESDRFSGERQRIREILDSASEMQPGPNDIICSFSEIPDEDWSETWKAHFKPLRVGKHFLITPTWEPAAPGPDDIVILIDPGRAFGTGHHETTRLCLEWLESWAGSRKPSPLGSLLDVGTGSGILAMGAALLGFETILGIDNDPEAIEVAVPNIELNGLAGKIRLLCCPPEDTGGLFDVLVSNIQSLPLIRMAETLVSKVKDGGRLVLTGILTEQAEDVRIEYEKKGVRLIETKIDGEWILLDFEK
jgi:ribosomal protein L11 methyltransferase